VSRVGARDEVACVCERFALRMVLRRRGRSGRYGRLQGRRTLGTDCHTGFLLRGRIVRGALVRYGVQLKLDGIENDYAGFVTTDRKIAEKFGLEPTSS